MLVLGLQGSPRLDGNTGYLLSRFLHEAEKMGARTRLVEVDKQNIVPCKEYIVCEKKGFCPIDDDMKHEVYPLLREAEVIAAASPIFFYNMTAQLKGLVDRCQVFWARKYKFKLKDPACKQRKGLLLSVGATRGKNLFEGLELGVKYFFDALDAEYAGSLTYRGIEHAGDMEKHPDIDAEVSDAAKRAIGPLCGRKKILFVGRNNACASQIAGAFAQKIAGEYLDVATAGLEPADTLDRNMLRAMEEIKIDMKFRKIQSAEVALQIEPPDAVVFIGRSEEALELTGPVPEIWDMETVGENSMEGVRRIRDEIEKRVSVYVESCGR